MRDPVAALDFDLAVAARARKEMEDELSDLLNQEDGGFFTGVLYLLRALVG